MSHRDDSAGPPSLVPPTRSSADESPSAGQLVAQLSQELAALVRDEMRLAQTEMTGKAKKAGVGAGMFGVAGLLALYACGVLIATVILVLALSMDLWLAALIVGVVLAAAAGVAALVGKNRMREAGGPAPTRAVENVKRDVDALRHPDGA